jgi:hypothetical protein
MFVFSELFPYLSCVLFDLFVAFDLYTGVTGTKKINIIVASIAAVRYIVED